jgi:hypothetical protein
MKATWIAAAFLLMSLAPASAEDLETTHLFGFTLGSDTNAVGEKEAEFETTGRFGKRAGSYSALSQFTGLKFTPVDNFTIEPGLSVSRYDISAVPGLDDRRQTEFEAFSFETRYRVLDRTQAPFGLTFGADPQWSRVDAISGEPVDRYGLDLLMIADQELVADRLFAAFNLGYGTEAARSRVTGAWEHQSALLLAAAATAQVLPGVFAGAEARQLLSYDGLGLDRLSGQALFVGPTLYARFAERFWISAAWNIQVAGRPSGDAAALDLANFERHQATLRFGVNF